MQKSSSSALQKSTRKGVMLLTKLILAVLSDKSSSSFLESLKKVGAPASCSCKATRTGITLLQRKCNSRLLILLQSCPLIKGMRTVGFSLHYVVRLQVQD